LHLALSNPQKIVTRTIYPSNNNARQKKTTIAATKLISTLFASDITTKYPIWSLPQITISEFIEGKTSHRELV
jgi:hypothetical protein